MKNKILATIMIFVTLTFPLTVFADRKSYKPPAEKGTVYVIVKFRQGFGPQPTNISINWGNYNRSETIKPPLKGLFPGSGIPEGFVIKLRHTKNDSIELGAESDGSIQNIYQGSEPGECSKGEWKCISW
ncbi:MAG: hypothetical protein ACR2IA_06635 [Pyrinomonadaceae bacterium]